MLSASSRRTALKGIRSLSTTNKAAAEKTSNIAEYKVCFALIY